MPATPIGGGPVPVLNPTTGEVAVPPGTPAGTYTITYTICDLINPTNCDTATVTVTVGAAVIDAVDDSFGPIVGAVGGTTPTVLTNDTLGGNPVTVGVGGNVTLTPGAAPTPAAGSLVMNPDGTITVAAGTTAGTYLYPYTICEVLNPTNCDTATATVVVSAAVIDAVNDTGTVANGSIGGVAVPNVLVNDTLNGVPATLATVTITQVSTTNPNVTINPATGAVNVAPGTPAGTYTLVYQICEILNPTNCDTATVTVTVGAAVIDAVDDSFGPIVGAVGGNTPSVLINDTLGGNPVTVGVGGNVTLTPGAAPTPAAGSLVMNPDGTITVARGHDGGHVSVPVHDLRSVEPDELRHGDRDSGGQCGSDRRGERHVRTAVNGVDGQRRLRATRSSNDTLERRTGEPGGDRGDGDDAGDADRRRPGARRLDTRRRARSAWPAGTPAGSVHDHVPDLRTAEPDELRHGDRSR